MFYTPPSRFAPPTYPRKKLPTAADQPPQPQTDELHETPPQSSTPALPQRIQPTPQAQTLEPRNAGTGSAQATQGQQPQQPPPSSAATQVQPPPKVQPPLPQTATAKPQAQLQPPSAQGTASRPQAGAIPSRPARSEAPATSEADTPTETSGREGAEDQRGVSWNNRPPQTQPGTPAAKAGRWFEKRSTPAAFFTQQGLGASGPSSQQGLQGSQRAIAAQQQVRRPSPPVQGGRPAAQPQAPVQPQAPAQYPAQGGPAMQQNQGTDSTKQGAGTTPAKDGKDPLAILSEKFAAFPDAARALKQLYTLPTGKLMIDKLSTLADKIKIEQTPGNESYMDNGVFRVRQNLDEATLAHEFQHLGEMLFKDKNPFLKVEHPEDVKKYPDLTHYDYEFRAMRMQNQIRLERARMNKTRPLLHPVYYDKTGAYPIPGSLLPQP